MAFDPAMSFFLVGSDRTALAVVRSLLQQLDATSVEDATNAADAFTKMRIKRYGLVISDWRIEPITGCDFVRKMRSDPLISRTPFIMTGESRFEHVVAAKNAGANCYIVKPFSAQTLKSKIEAALATRSSFLERQQSALQPGKDRASVATRAGRVKFEGVFTTTW